MAQLDLSLIVPTYNERENLPHLFAQLDRALAGYQFEVILVDDDSPDRTWALAEEFRASYNWLRVVRRVDERGLGCAVVCGFRHAVGNVLAVIDADLQHDIARLPQLIEAMSGVEFAVATRRAEGGTDGSWSRARKLTSWGATLLARALTRVPLSDPMSGFFALRREIFAALDRGDLQPRGYKILLYLYSRAVQTFGADRIRCREFGYEFDRRQYGKSKLTVKVMLEFLLMLFDLRFGVSGRIAESLP